MTLPFQVARAMVIRSFSVKAFPASAQVNELRDEKNPYDTIRIPGRVASTNQIPCFHGQAHLFPRAPRVASTRFKVAS